MNFRRTALVNAERRLCNANKTIVAALSEYVKQQFEEHYDLCERRIAVIPNGIAIRESIDTAAAETLRTQIFSSPAIAGKSDFSLFLFAANNFRLKGLTSLIRAMHLLDNDKIVLLVAGTGKQVKYLALAQDLGVADRVLFLGALEDIQPALSIADVAVLPTYYDPCSRFILEALSRTKPVITTRYNGASERYTDNRHGCIIDDPNNIEALAKAMAHLADPENAKIAAQAIIEDKLNTQISIATHAESMIQLYENILSKRKLD